MAEVWSAVQTQNQLQHNWTLLKWRRKSKLNLSVSLSPEVWQKVLCWCEKSTNQFHFLSFPLLPRTCQLPEPTNERPASLGGDRVVPWNWLVARWQQLDPRGWEKVGLIGCWSGIDQALKGPNHVIFSCLSRVNRRVLARFHKKINLKGIKFYI